MPAIKPMLASAVDDVNKLRFPCVVSPKLDGIRFIKLDGHGLTRKLKPIRNTYIRTTLEALCPDGIDGEIMAGDTFQSCDSAVMTEDGQPAFTLWAFDLVTDVAEPYCSRIARLSTTVTTIDDPRVKFVPIKSVNNVDQLLEFEREQLALGFEGVMIRDPRGPYKCGRSTAREGWLLKFKRFEDSEARVIGFEEQMHNENARTVNELGLSKRSSAAAGKTPAGTLGAFIARDDVRFPGVDLHIGTGTGLTAKLRKEIWDNKEAYLGKLIVYRYQAIGVKDAPRHPIWHGFRDPDDL